MEANDMIKNKYVTFGLFVVLFFAFWNLLELLYNTFITKSGYQFSLIIDLTVPLVVSVTIGYLLFLRKKKSDK